MFRSLILAFALFAAAPSYAQDIMSEEVLNTGAFNCSASGNTGWVNNKGYTLRILQIRIWPGVTYGARVDVALTVFGPTGQLAKLAQDRYAATNGPILEVTDLRPGSLLAPGQQLAFGYFCNKLGGSPAAQAHFGVDIWWIREP